MLLQLRLYRNPTQMQFTLFWLWWCQNYSDNGILGLNRTVESRLELFWTTTSRIGLVATCIGLFLTTVENSQTTWWCTRLQNTVFICMHKEIGTYLSLKIHYIIMKIHTCTRYYIDGWISKNYLYLDMGKIIKMMNVVFAWMSSSWPWSSAITSLYLAA